MSKIVPLPLQTPELTKLKQALVDKHLSFVLITCSEPSEGGKMDVELSYEGDKDLIAYLVESAQGYLD